mmetsp:Transcript_43264/g.71482  ORF Transcript_43264/g.71482 Transcript_43264/m.71482 type:complete len:333 (+) Transcript_43264:45-1043(+)
MMYLGLAFSVVLLNFFSQIETVLALDCVTVQSNLTEDSSFAEVNALCPSSRPILTSCGMKASVSTSTSLQAYTKIDLQDNCKVTSYSGGSGFSAMARCCAMDSQECRTPNGYASESNACSGSEEIVGCTGYAYRSGYKGVGIDPQYSWRCGLFQTASSAAAYPHCCLPASSDVSSLSCSQISSAISNGPQITLSCDESPQVMTSCTFEVASNQLSNVNSWYVNEQGQCEVHAANADYEFKALAICCDPQPTAAPTAVPTSSTVSPTTAPSAATADPSSSPTGSPTTAAPTTVAPTTIAPSTVAPSRSPDPSKSSPISVNGLCVILLLSFFAL